eukprot:tig00000492_g1468.t1
MALSTPPSTTGSVRYGKSMLRSATDAPGGFGSSLAGAPANALRASASSAGGLSSKYELEVARISRMVQPAPAEKRGGPSALRQNPSMGSLHGSVQSLFSMQGSQHGSLEAPLNPTVSRSLQDGNWRRLDTPPEMARRSLETVPSAPPSFLEDAPGGRGPGPGLGLGRRPSMGAMSTGSNGSSQHSSFSELPRPESGPPAPSAPHSQSPLGLPLHQFERERRPSLSLGVPAPSHRTSPRGAQRTQRRRSTPEGDDGPMPSGRRSSVLAQQQQQVAFYAQRCATLEGQIKAAERKMAQMQADMDVQHNLFWKQSGQVRDLEKRVKMLTRNEPREKEKQPRRDAGVGAAPPSPQGPAYMRAKKLATFGRARTTSAPTPWAYVLATKANAVLLGAVRAAARVPEISDPELLRLLKQLSLDPADVSLDNGGTTYEGYHDALLLPEPVYKAAQVHEVTARNAYLEARVAELEGQLKEKADHYASQMARVTQLESEVQFLKHGILQFGSRKLIDMLGVEGESAGKEAREARARLQKEAAGSGSTGLLLSLPGEWDDREPGAGGEHRLNAMQDAIDRISSSIQEMSTVIEEGEVANERGRREVVGLLQGVLRSAVTRDVAFLHAPEAEMETIPALGARGRSIKIRVPKGSGVASLGSSTAAVLASPDREGSKR